MTRQRATITESLFPLDILGKNNEFLAQMRRREVNVDDIF